MSRLKRVLPVILFVTSLILVDFSAVRGESLPDSAYVYGVVGHPQSYSISCEARSAGDLAGFWGVNISETEFLQALPSSDNPDLGYVGNPNDVWGRTPPHSYGVHADPIAETLRDFGLAAEAHHNLTWDDLRGEISADHPVIVWVIGAMWPGTPIDYTAADGSVVRVAAFEHSMLLTGYSGESVEVIDAYSGKYQYYRLSDFLESWKVLGNMAVFVSGVNSLQQDPETIIQGETYTVQPGDYLMGLARELGVSWQELAELNAIQYPYTLFTGQVLQLPGGTSQETQAEVETATVPPEPGPGDIYKVYLPIVMGAPAAPGTPTAQTGASDAHEAETVTVLHSNTLVGFGRSIGIAWHVLARLNSLLPTYIVHPGEILRVK